MRLCSGQGIPEAEVSDWREVALQSAELGDNEDGVIVGAIVVAIDKQCVSGVTSFGSSTLEYTFALEREAILRTEVAESKD